MTAILEHMPRIERRLVAHGFPATSPWWRETLVRFYKSGRRQLVLRVGRRGGKSSTLCRVAVLEALYGEHKIPPGDLGIIAIISTHRDEAAQRLRTVKAILDALGVPYKSIDNGIELLGRPVAFKVFTASISGVSGFTAIAAICDEVAKWKDSESGVNPAREVLASLRPTMATQRHARIFLSSSPLSTLDAHYDAFELGDTDGQLVAYAPTWLAHPALTRDELRRDEPDPRVFAREYEAIPMAALAAAFDVDQIDRAMRGAPATSDGYRRGVMVIDPSSGRGDAFTHAWAQWFVPRVTPDAFERTALTARVWRQGREVTEVVQRDGEIALDGHGFPIVKSEWRDRIRPQLVISGMGAWDGPWFGVVSLDDVVAELARRCIDGDVHRVVGDQREEAALLAAFARHGLRYIPLAWTQPTKADAVATLRRHFAEGSIVLPRSDKLRRELLSFSEKVTPSGAITYGARASAKDDRVALLLTATMADAEGLLPGSPLRTKRGRNDAFAERRQILADVRAND